jgi:hypothetical protein
MISEAAASKIRNNQKAPNGNPVRRVEGNGRQTCVTCLHPITEDQHALDVGGRKYIHGKAKFCVPAN